MVKGIVNLAPLSNPTNVKVPLIEVFVGANKVLIVVPLKLNWVPIIVFETSVPKVVLRADWAYAFAFVVAVDSIPNPVNVFNNLISDTVHAYPLVSNP